MKKMTILLAVTLLVVGAGGFAAAEEKTPQSDHGPFPEPLTEALPSPRVTQLADATEVVGTIVYDDGILNFTPAISSLTYGNRFNTAGGNPLTASGSVTQVTFYMFNVGGTGGFVSFFDQLNGTTANLIDSSSYPMVPGTNTLAVGPFAYVGNSFLAGVWYFGSDSVGLGSGTVGGQGFHGFVINDIVATGYFPLTVNALFRATGDVLPIPVELMTFDVVD